VKCCKIGCSMDACGLLFSRGSDALNAYVVISVQLSYAADTPPL
jgi:hypothetical protein